MVNLYHRFNLIKECEFSKEKIVAELQKYKLKNNLKYSIFFPNEEGRTEERKVKVKKGYLIFLRSPDLSESFA